MIIKIWLPKYVWDSIIKYSGFKKHTDMIDVILKDKFIPRIKEFANHYKYGNVKWMKDYYKFVLYGKPCIVSDDIISEVYELLKKENLFLEIKEIECLFSYSIMVFLAEDLDKLYGDSLPETGQAL